MKDYKKRICNIRLLLKNKLFSALSKSVRNLNNLNRLSKKY